MFFPIHNDNTKVIFAVKDFFDIEMVLVFTNKLDSTNLNTKNV